MRTHRFATSLAIAVSLVALPASSAPDESVSAASDTGVAQAAGVRVVSATEAQTLLAADPAPTLIDVRTPTEFADGHLAGADLVDLDASDFRDQIAEYPRDASYVIYCRSGNRSEGARRIMTELGFDDVADIDGGIVAWDEAGLPIES